MNGIFRFVSTANRDRLIGRNSNIGWNNLGKLKTLKLEETAADVVEIGRIKLSPSNLTEEMVEGVVPALPSLIIVCGRGRCAVVRHWTVTGVLSSLLKSISTAPIGQEGIEIKAYLDRWVRLVILVRMMLASVVARPRNGRSIVVLPDLTGESVTIVRGVVVRA